MLHRFTLALLALAAISPKMAVAVPTYYFPGTNINYTGGSNSFPLNSTSSNKCQFLYLPSDFNSLPTGPFLITTVYIKPSASQTNRTLSNLTIKLGNSNLTTLNTGAWVSGLTTVYLQSSVTISTTANQWKAFTLSTPFLYTGGAIVFELSHTSSAASGITINQFTVTGRNGRLYGGVTSSTGTGNTATSLFGFDGVPAACSGTPLAAVITTPAMNAAAPLCAGNTKSLTATNPNGPVTGLNFQWQQAAASTGPFSNVSSGTGGTTLNYTTGPVSGTTWYRLRITCTNSSAVSYSNPYVVYVGAQQPSSIVGRGTSCPGDTATYSVNPTAGHTYTWTLPTGWTGTSTTNSIHVTMGASPGTISVTATGCGGTSVARTRTISAGTSPGQPAGINGATMVCSGTTHTYSVMPVSTANSYTWTLPAGWSGSSSTNTITVTSGSASGNIRVKASNGCGSSSESVQAVSVITTLANPGIITSSASNGTYCAGQLYTFSINPVPGATSYAWVLPSGWAGTISGTSIQAFAGNSGQVQALAMVSCATSPAATLTVSVDTVVNPSVSITASASTLCSGQPVTFTATPRGGGTSPVYLWKKNGNPLLGSGNTYLSGGLNTGDLISVSMTSNAKCRTADTAHSPNFAANVITSIVPGISINSNPVIKICEGKPLSFNTIRTGEGATPSYQWYINGSPVPGAKDTSFFYAGFHDNDTLTVQMTSSAVCATTPQNFSNKVAISVTDTVHPNVSITSTAPIAGRPTLFTLTHYGGGGSPDYQWIRNNVEIPNATGNTYATDALVAGDHIAVRMLSYADCAAPTLVTSNEIIIVDPNGVSNTATASSTISLYPNPSGGRFTLSVQSEEAQGSQARRIQVVNMLGQSVYDVPVMPSGQKWQHEVVLGEQVANGRYHLRITGAGFETVNIPVIIAR